MYGHERSIKVKKNILSLFFLKGFNFFINFSLIPLTYNLLDKYQYGIWITMFNVLSWISIFDIGMGNGLRNKFSEAIAIGKTNEARIYVSTAYVVMSVTSICLILFFIFPWYFFDWNKLFNVQIDFGNDLFYLVGITFFLTSLQFTFKLIGTLLTAIHRTYLTALLGIISNTLVFLLLYTLQNLVIGNLILVGLIYTGIPLLVFILSSIYFFYFDLKDFRPKLSLFSKSKVEDLFSLGFKFFIIQVAVMVFFSTDSIIISHVLSPDEVASYNIVFRYFSIVTTFSGILMIPMWSAYTEAISKHDILWIKMALKKQMKLMIFILLIVIGLLSASNILIQIWINDNIEFSPLLLWSMAIYTIVFVWNNIFSFLLNGLSVLNLQVYTSLVGMFFNIPLSIYLAKIWGNAGVIIATTICLLLFSVLGPIQVLFYFKNKKIG